MTTTKHYDDVRSFMLHAGQELPELPCIPDSDVRLLRAKLMLEEVLETVHALGVTVQLKGGDILCEKEGIRDLIFDCHDQCDLVEVLDGCCDVAVVTTGTLIACGIEDYYPQKYVNDSNLAKFGIYCVCGNTENILVDKETHEAACPECEYDNWYIGYKRDDGKWIKPSNWKVPDLKEALHEQSALEEDLNLKPALHSPPSDT